MHKGSADVVHVQAEVDGRAQLLELPGWMLDRAACASMQLVEHPCVGCGELRGLRELLLHVTSSEATIDRHLGSPSPGDADAQSSIHNVAPNSTSSSEGSPNPQRATRSLSAAADAAVVVEPAAGSAQSPAGVAGSTAADAGTGAGPVSTPKRATRRTTRNASRKGGRR
jgi:hypothetical protein